MKYIKTFENLNKKYNIDDILEAYLECALWTHYDEDEIEDKNIDNFDDKSIEISKRDIEWFLKASGKILDSTDEQMIGHDLWLSRNGHGSGFFDRDIYSKDDLEILEDLCQFLGNSNTYVLRNGKVSIEQGYRDLDNFNIEEYYKEKEFKKTTKKYNI